MGLWNFTTTIRGPDRIKDFARVAKQFVGQKWVSGDQIQIDFQIALIRNKLYLQDEIQKKFPDKPILTLEEATGIASGKHDGWRWKDPPMRGRQSLSPLRKLGIFYLDENKIIRLTQKGNQLTNCEISYNQYLEDVLLQYQSEDFNIIPLIGTIQLIDKVNNLWEKKGHNPTGLSLLEFSLFVPSLTDHSMIDSQAELVIKFREEYSNASTLTEEKEIESKYQKMFADDNLQADWDNQNATDGVKEKIKLMKKRYGEYGVNNIALYFRSAGWIQYRGGGFRIDLNPLKKIENEEILGMSCKPMQHDTEQAYAEYLSGKQAFEIPWRTKEKLIEKYNLISKKIQDGSQVNNIAMNITLKQSKELEQLELYQLDTEIDVTKQELKRILSENQTQEVIHVDKIKEIIYNLKNPPSSKAYVELEYETTRGLMALDDGEIKPNYPLGDDGLPTNTAPSGAGDIESFYEKFNLLTEVTMLTNRTQQYQEGDPVTRHYVKFATKRDASETYCLFIAPQMHEDTINQFFFQNNRRAPKQTRIIPITITQFIEILELLIKLKEKNPSYKFSHENLTKLFDPILDSMANYDDDLEWRNNIQSIIDSWKEEILANS